MKNNNQIVIHQLSVIIIIYISLMVYSIEIIVHQQSLHFLK